MTGIGTWPARECPRRRRVESDRMHSGGHRLACSVEGVSRAALTGARAAAKRMVFAGLADQDRTSG